MSGERSGHVAASGPDLQPSWDALEEAAERPSASRALARSSGFAAREDSAEARPLIGRERELRDLQSVYAAAQLEGRAAFVVVRGDSGIGKTALCSAFERALSARGDTLVLSARCYERDHVAFNAFAGLIAELSAYLQRLPHGDCEALRPEHVGALARLFPALGHVFERAPSPMAVLDAAELRRRGVSALAELLRQLSERATLVLSIDDLHWADPDSIALLRELLIQRGLAPFMLLASLHDQAARTGEVEELLSALADHPGLDIRSVRLALLAFDDSRALAESLLGEPAGADETLALAQACHGNPLLATAFATCTLTPGSTFDGVYGELLRGLAPTQRALLSVIALAGRPVPIELALTSASATPADFDVLLCASLVSRSLGGAVAYSHERVRDALCQQLSAAERQGTFLALLAATEGTPDAEPELMCRCASLAHAPQAAASFAVLAGDRAAASLAFERAAALYQTALSLAAFSPAEELALTEKLGQAFEHAGRSQDAADSYVRAAKHARGLPKLELMRRASAQLLLIGQVASALGMLQTLSDDTVVRAPDGSARAHIQRLLSQWQLQLQQHGLKRAPRSGTVLSAQAALRLQSLRTLSAGLVGHSPSQALTAATRYLQLALESRDSLHLTRALGLHAALGGGADLGNRWPDRALARMDAVVRDTGVREAQAFGSLVHAVVCHSHDEFAAARTHASRALSLLRDCSGVAWEIDRANLLDQMSAYGAGDYADLVRTTPPLVDEAFRRGRVHVGALLSGVSGLPAWLAPDDPEGYRDVIAEARGRLMPGTAHDHVLALGEAALSVYLGDAALGFDLLEHIAVDPRRSVQHAKGQGMCAAAALSDLSKSDASGRRAQLRDKIERCIRTLDRFGGPACISGAESLRAALALDAGLWLQASHRLAAALQLQAAAGLAMSAAATRRRLGQLTGSAAGRRLVANADASMRAQGIINLEAMTELLCPGVRS